MGAEILALFLSLKEKPSRIKVKNHTDWPDYIPERTCKKRNHDTDSYYMKCFSCSLCNAGWFEDIYDKPFSYCPHCGAKVVE